MNILEKIVAQKRKEVDQHKQETTLTQLEHGPFYQAETYSLKECLLDKNKTGIIAEFKRQSPSKGIINGNASVEEITQAYTYYGASGISVLNRRRIFWWYTCRSYKKLLLSIKFHCCGKIL